MSVMEAAASRRPQKPEDAKAEGQGQKTLADEDPRLQETYEFDFSYTGIHGKRYTGRFRNRILSIADHAEVGMMRSRMVGGVPWNSLDANTIAITEMVCHCVQSLENLEDVAWAKELSSQTDIALIEALYAEVSGHEAIFHGRRPPDGGSVPKGDGDA
jgi:hypothetical protein